MKAVVTAPYHLKGRSAVVDEQAGLVYYGPLNESALRDDVRPNPIDFEGALPFMLIQVSVESNREVLA